MQHLTYFRTGAVRLTRITYIYQRSTNAFKLSGTSQCCLSSTNASQNSTNDNIEIRKQQNTKEAAATMMSDQKGTELKNTIDLAKQSPPTLDGAGKIWSDQSNTRTYATPFSTMNTTLDSTLTGKLKTTDPFMVTRLNFKALPIQVTEEFDMKAPKCTNSNQSSSTAPYLNVTNDPSEAKNTSNSNANSNQCEVGIREEILRSALKYVDEHGWSIEAIRAGISACNQSTTLEGLFSSGYDLIEFFQRDANAKMADFMKEQKQKNEIQGSRLLIEGIKYRLSLVVPYSNTWSQALAQGALPQNALRSWNSLFELSSEAWYGIGDTSTDVNWYSKRLLLSAIYKSAEIYMLQDQSPDKIDTINFLERRLNDFQTMSTIRNTVSKSISDTAQLANGVFSVIRNLTSRR